MNRVLLSLTVLLAVSSVAYSIVCTPDLCNGAKCVAYTAENCAGVIVPKGGFCGCCDSCETLLKAGEACLSLHLLGIPVHSRCVDGYFCDSATSTCQPLVI